MDMKPHTHARIVLLSAALFLPAFLPACESQQTRQARADGKPCAECLVCKKNADLACVNVVVDEKTPKAEYQGKTYYFCSEECRDNFLKNPGKYAAK